MKTKQTIDFSAVLRGDEMHVYPTSGEVIESAFAMLSQHCHAASYNRGWWHDPITGLSLIPVDHISTATPGTYQEQADRENRRFVDAWFPYVIATKIALIHSEVTEMLEAVRRDKDDDKIPFAGVTAEGGDVVIRVCDLIGMLQHTDAPSPMGRAEDYNLGLAILTKIPFNGARPDHDLAARALPGGKKY